MSDIQPFFLSFPRRPNCPSLLLFEWRRAAGKGTTLFFFFWRLVVLVVATDGSSVPSGSLMVVDTDRAKGGSNTNPTGRTMNGEEKEEEKGAFWREDSLGGGEGRKGAAWRNAVAPRGEAQLHCRGGGGGGGRRRRIPNRRSSRSG